MDLQGLIILLIIGAIAGWLAGMIVKGMGFGLIGNIIVGIVGAFIGTWLLGDSRTSPSAAALSPRSSMPPSAPWSCSSSSAW